MPRPLPRALSCALLTAVLAAPLTLPAPAGAQSDARDLRVASFNVSMFRATEGELARDLAVDGDEAQDEEVRGVAEVLQRTRPDVVLLNELDVDLSGEAVDRFRRTFLEVPQNGAEPIRYPHALVLPSNTGVASGFDLDDDGSVGTSGRDYGDDAFGFGEFPGQYGFAVLSRYPIDRRAARTFQTFRWKDMPGARLPDDPSTPAPADFYEPEELEVLRLSSKNHADVPVRVAGRTVHLLASHPTPPVFDGPEDRNGRRNADEIRFWADYVVPGSRSAYVYDDRGGRGGLAPGEEFVVVGDLNTDPFDGDSVPGAAQQLLEHPRVQDPQPRSAGAVEQARLQGGANAAHRGDPALDTADFNDRPAPGNLRADYVLPSRGLQVRSASVFWPTTDDPLFRLVGTFDRRYTNGFPSSDHRLVQVDLTVPKAQGGPRGPELVGDAVLPKQSVEGTTVGGLSGTAYDAQRGVYYALSDDRTGARFYTLAVSPTADDVRVLAVTGLTDAAGQPFPANALDPEGLALTRDRTLLVTSEGDAARRIPPFVREFSLAGRQLRELPVPDHYAPTGSSGVRNNLAFESAGLTPDGRTFFTATENALVQDGPAATTTTGSPSRLLRYDAVTGALQAELVFPVDPVDAAPVPAGSFSTNGLVELLPLTDQRLLALERQFVNGVGNSVQLFLVETAGATDVRGSAALPERVRPVRKTLLLDLDELGLPLDNLEALALGPVLPDGRRSLLVTSDDNFSPGQVTQLLVLALPEGRTG